MRMPVTRAVGVVEDPRYREHLAPPGHPERPERLAAVHEAIAERASQLEPVASRAAEDSAYTAFENRFRGSRDVVR